MSDEGGEEASVSLVDEFTSRLSNLNMVGLQGRPGRNGFRVPSKRQIRAIAKENAREGRQPNWRKGGLDKR